MKLSRPLALTLLASIMSWNAFAQENAAPSEEEGEKEVEPKQIVETSLPKIETPSENRPVTAQASPTPVAKAASETPSSSDDDDDELDVNASDVTNKAPAEAVNAPKTTAAPEAPSADKPTTETAAPVTPVAAPSEVKATDAIPTPPPVPKKVVPQQKPVAPAPQVKVIPKPAVPAPAAPIPAPTPVEPKKTLKPSDVGLTAEQNSAILKIRAASDAELEKKLVVEIRAARADLNASMVGSIAPDEVRKKFDLLQKKSYELQKIKFERTLKIREVLTVEQRKKLNQVKTSH